MMPHERSLVERLKDKPFALIGVNGDNGYDGEEFKTNVAKHKVTWRSFRNEPSPDQPALADVWNLEGWPTLYLIDAKGTIRKIWLGSPDDEDELDHEIEVLIAEAEGKPKPERKQKEPAKPKKPSEHATNP